MKDEIALQKCKTWYEYLSPTAKIEFIEYLWRVDRHKVDFASMSEPLRRFYNPNLVRPTKEEVDEK